jgi:Coenzyme PQQ synthesis protein D (PqqD)
MANNTALDVTSLLASKVNVPQNVVYRSFPAETVVLNLETGKYHGLNPTAGHMLATLEKAATVRDAVIDLAASYEQPRTVIERDLHRLCNELLARDLINVDRPLSA